MPGQKIISEECLLFLLSIEKAQDVKYTAASSSLPAGILIDIFELIAVIPRNKNTRLIIDTSGEALKYAIEAGVYLMYNMEPLTT
jgi:6-phosphofructokinase 2